MTLKTIAPAIFGLILAPMAHADCPTRADLATGIRFEVATGEWEIFRQVSDAVVEATYFYDPSEGTQALLARGVYVLQLVEQVDGALLPDTRQTYSFPLQPRDMPDPVDGGAWNVEVAILSEDGLSQEVQSYQFGAPRRQGFGACFYQLIPITIRYGLEGEDSFETETVHYLPELGLSYLAGSQGSDYEDIYEYIGVKALK